MNKVDTYNLLYYQSISINTVSEITGKSYRAAIGVTWQMLFALGYATLPGIAFFIRDHVKLQIVITAPAIILFAYFL